MSINAYQICPGKDHCGVSLISDALPFGRLWYTKIPDAIGYAKFYSRSHPTVIHVYDDAGILLETHEQAANTGISTAVYDWP